MIQDNVFYHHSSCHGNYNYTSSAGLFFVLVKAPDLNCCCLFCSTLCNTPQGHKNSTSVPRNTPANCNTMQSWHFLGFGTCRAPEYLELLSCFHPPSFPCRSSTPTSSCCFVNYDLDTAAAASTDLQLLGLASARYSDLGLEKVVRYAMACYGMVWYGMVWQYPLHVGWYQYYLCGRLLRSWHVTLGSFSF